MSVPRSLTIGILAAIGGLAVNILTEFVVQIGFQSRWLAPAIVTAVLVVTLLVSAALQRGPDRPPDTNQRLYMQLDDHRRDLYALKERCRSEGGWTTGCVELWQQRQREIAAIKAALTAARLPYADEPIDSSPPPRLGCLTRAALVAKTATALLVVPLVGFSIGLVTSAAAFQRLDTDVVLSRLLRTPTPEIIARITPTATPRVFITENVAAATVDPILASLTGTRPVTTRTATAAPPTATVSPSPSPLTNPSAPTATAYSTPVPPTETLRPPTRTRVAPPPPTRPLATPTPQQYVAYLQGVNAFAVYETATGSQTVMFLTPMTKDGLRTKVYVCAAAAMKTTPYRYLVAPQPCFEGKPYGWISANAIGDTVPKPFPEALTTPVVLRPPVTQIAPSTPEPSPTPAR